MRRGWRAGSRGENIRRETGKEEKNPQGLRWWRGDREAETETDRDRGGERQEETERETEGEKEMETETEGDRELERERDGQRQSDRDRETRKGSEREERRECKPVRGRKKWSF